MKSKKLYPGIHLKVKISTLAAYERARRICVGYAAYRLRYLAMRAEESLTKIERYAYNKVGASGNTGLRCRCNGTAAPENQSPGQKTGEMKKPCLKGGYYPGIRLRRRCRLLSLTSKLDAISRGMRTGLRCRCNGTTVRIG